MSLLKADTHRTTLHMQMNFPVFTSQPVFTIVRKEKNSQIIKRKKTQAAKHQL